MQVIIPPGQQNSCAAATVGGVLGGFIGLTVLIAIALGIALGVSEHIQCSMTYIISLDGLTLTSPFFPVRVWPARLSMIRPIHTYILNLAYCFADSLGGEQKNSWTFEKG